MTLLLAALADGPRHAASELAMWAAEHWGPRQEDVHVDAIVVPRTYADSAAQVEERLASTRPDLFVLLDTDPTSPEWKLHHLAANYDDDERPDAGGVARRDQIIDPGGPVAYRSRLPLDGLWDKFLVERVPNRMSHRAVHVLNHVFYRTMHTISTKGLPTLGGALETPPMGGPNGRPRTELLDEMSMVLAVLVRLYPAALKASEAVAGDGTP